MVLDDVPNYLWRRAILEYMPMVASLISDISLTEGRGLTEDQKKTYISTISMNLSTK